MGNAVKPRKLEKIPFQLEPSEEPHLSHINILFTPTVLSTSSNLHILTLFKFFCSNKIMRNEAVKDQSRNCKQTSGDKDRKGDTGATPAQQSP